MITIDPTFGSHASFSGSASVSLSLTEFHTSAFGLSAIIKSRLCNIDATNRKIEHMPNITVIGNALTLYSTMHTKMLRGIRKKFMMVLLASSGMYWDLIFMMDGQNIPTQASNAQKPISCIQPEKEMLPPLSLEGTTKKVVTIGRSRAAADITKTICM